MKRISVLGSTGSIGRQTLDIVRSHKEDFQVLALSARGGDLELLAQQIEEFAPELVALASKKAALELSNLVGRNGKTEILAGEEGICAAASASAVEIVVSGLVGACGIKPTAAAARAGKTIALANKETLVAAGAAIMSLVKEGKAEIVPVDSEHSAIFQSLGNYASKDLRKIILTGSGGPFRTWTLEQMKDVRIEDALKHPNWSMGQKITIDSATLMNKGLEIIEARWLFNLPASKIEVLIHPQSILHSAVEFVDGSVVGQLGLPDMHLPIHYALYYPERSPSREVPQLDLAKIASLSFESPDYGRFPCLALARQVADLNDSSAAVLNAANEEMVHAFLARQIGFCEIARYVEKILDRHNPVLKPSLDDILDADRWARLISQEILGAKV